MALIHHVSIAVDIYNLGHLEFWQQVMNDLNINMSPLLRKYLLMKDKKEENRREYQRKTEVKRERSRDVFEKTSNRKRHNIWSRGGN